LVKTVLYLAQSAKMAKFVVSEVCALSAKTNHQPNAIARMGLKAPHAAIPVLCQVERFVVDMENVISTRQRALLHASVLMSSLEQPAHKHAQLMRMAPFVVAMASAR